MKKALILCFAAVVVFLSCKEINPSEYILNSKLINEGYVHYTHALELNHEKIDPTKTYQSKVVIEYDYRDFELKFDDSVYRYREMNQFFFSLFADYISFKHVFHSKFAPFSELVVDQIDDQLISNLKSFSSKEYIKYIYVFHEEIAGGSPDFSSERPFFEFVDPDSGQTNYESVKIGVFETKVTMLDRFNSSLLGLKSLTIHPDIVVHFNPFDVYHRHATHVSATVATEFGNNSKLDLYFSNITVGFFQGIEWFLEEGVDILNMSFNSSNSNEGIYTSHSRYLDYISYHHPIIFVTGAGNRGQSTKLVGGTAFNIITVGSLTPSNQKNLFELADYSSYLLDPSLINSKPNLVALGFSYNNQWIGTSFAAPRVAGVIAKWMSYYPSLKENKPLIFSLLHTSATRKQIIDGYNTYDPSGLEKMIGAGELSFHYGVSMIENQTLTELKVPNTSHQYPKEIYRKEVYLNQNQTLRISVASLVQVISLDATNSNISINDYRIRLLYNGFQILSTFGKTNIEMLVYHVSFSGNYEIVVTAEQRLNNLRGYDQVGISYRISSVEPRR